MKSNTLDVLSSRIIAATVTLLVVATGGCDRREEVYPAEGHAYTRDPAYIAQLDAQVAERDALVEERCELQRQLDVLLKKFGDNVAVTNSAEGAALYAKLVANFAAYDSNRMHTAAIMRERIKRATADSERIKRGEAKAIDISKKVEEVK